MTINSNCYNAGYNAYIDGLDSADNPYPDNTINYDNWGKGWFDAELDLFPQRRQRERILKHKMEITVKIQRDGWTWTIQPQEDCLDGVVIHYKEDHRDPLEKEIHLGGLDDAEALADAIKFYVKHIKALKEADLPNLR